MSQENAEKKATLENGELQELLDSAGISVWGQHQSVLEEQALTHIQQYTAKESEDGEVSSSDDEKTIIKKPEIKGLDLNQYLASQARLKQYQVKKQRNISDKSKQIADRISQRQTDDGLKGKKRKHVPSFQFSKEKFVASGVNNVKKIGLCVKKCQTSNFADERYCSDEFNNETQKVCKLTIQNDHDYAFVEHNVSETVQNEPAFEIGDEKCNKKVRLGVFDNEKIQKSPDLNVKTNDSGSEYCPSDGYSSDSDYSPEKSSTKQKVLTDKKVHDDGSLSDFNTRLSTYKREKGIEDYNLNGLIIPGEIWSKLYTYQREGVEWMWELHKRGVGGLLGDEMGLGKTVQVIAFLAGLQYTQIKNQGPGIGPTIIVCPVTVIHQWIKHFHMWWPPFRVVLLHNSSRNTAQSNKTQLIRTIHRSNGIIVTNYETILKYKGVLIELKWDYLILDEGHKIRNPGAKITVAVKQFRGTKHRIMLTGSPMQNNLLELWSLFDFIVPARLGSQQAFVDHFATPITQGGYLNATPTQETTALLIATSLKDLISPYMLRRSKNDVGDSVYLPDKSEQVLFCSLTDEQRDLYKGYLLSEHVGSILGRTSGSKWSDHQKRANMLVAITTLRKICNHPDLYLGEADESDTQTTEVYGSYKRSGKLIVVSALLKIWKKQGHRVLLFTQSRSMLEIFQEMLEQQNYKYLKMDGTTTIASRQPLIDKFNKDSSYDVFLLTTRVGGLGVNLTGANRVIIYDPDWNPATDLQARERAWRIGQLRQVTVYRLLSAGTIEEKMYQRQVFKQLLSNKVLLDPRTHRFFKSSDLTELFSLQEPNDTHSETANIFRNSRVEIKTPNISETTPKVSFSEDKIKAMKDLAQKIAKNISQEKRPTPAELLALNRKKLEKPPEEPIVNKVNDHQTNLSFSTALELCVKKSEKEQPETGNSQQKSVKKQKKKKKDKIKTDNSGKIDGETIEGLLKVEMKKKQKKKDIPKPATQDDYVLEKLFSKKGVHTALQHDVIVQSGYKPGNSLKVHYEAKHKADMALKALRKSRLNNWRW